MDVFGATLFFLEFYHLLAHCMILFRFRLLPSKDLARQRHYFLVDTLTVATSSFLYTQNLRWLATIQILQHMFFYLNWNKHPYAIKVMHWSSLDWLTTKNHSHWHWDVVLGTGFDVVVHLSFMFLISQHLTTFEVGLGAALSVVALGIVMFNSRFAWSTPGQPMEPWVKKRISSVDVPDYTAKQG